MNRQYFRDGNRRGSASTDETAFRWWWAVLGPYVVLPISAVGLAMVGFPGVDGSFRSALALGLFLGAGLIHIALHGDARHLRTTGSGWTPRYRWYALGGAAVLLGVGLLLDVSVPGGIPGAVLLAGVFGIIVTAPVYLGRRYLAARRQ